MDNGMLYTRKMCLSVVCVCVCLYGGVWWGEISSKMQKHVNIFSEAGTNITTSQDFSVRA